MNILIIILILWAISGISKACADTVQHHLDNSIFKEKKFFDSTISWKNKWDKYSLINDEFGYRHWYYLFLYRTEYKEKFPFSSTILVFTTDAWHLFNFITYTCYELAIVRTIVGPISHYPRWYIWLLFIIMPICIFKIIKGLSFTLFYNKILINKKND